MKSRLTSHIWDAVQTKQCRRCDITIVGSFVIRSLVSSNVSSCLWFWWEKNSEYDIVSEEITFIYQSFDRLKLQWRGKAKQKHFFDFEKLTLQ